MAEQRSTIIEFPRGKYDPRKDEYFYRRFRARLRELVVLFGIGSVVSLAVFFLALWLLPFETFTPFPFPRFPGFPWLIRSGHHWEKDEWGTRARLRSVQPLDDGIHHPVPVELVLLKVIVELGVAEAALFFHPELVLAQHRDGERVAMLLIVATLLCTLANWVPNRPA
jgi:hypothetical protein